MKLNIAGRDVDLGESLTTRIETGIYEAVEKYFPPEGSGNVTVSKQGHLFEVDLNIHLPSGITLQASGRASDAHDAFNQTLERLEKRIRRYHRRLKDHQRPSKNASPPVFATSTIFESLASDENADTIENNEATQNPLTIAETESELPSLSVAEAIFQLELMDNPALMFMNSAHGRANMVYKRPDGHIGWVDPKT